MIAVEDEVFAVQQANEAQFGTFDSTKAALKLKRQRKRTSSRSHSSEGDDPVSPMSDDFPKLKLDSSFKRDRKSRMGTRGLPKKGGAGGKGVWGKMGDENNASAAKDDQDPNFDASDMGDKNIKLGAYIPELDLEEIDKYLRPLFLEYYENSELEECISAISKFNIGRENIGSVLVLAVSLALERTPATRELCSRLIAEMYARVIDPALMEDAFVVVLKQIPDLELDNPDAVENCGKFLARAIADDCFPPAFLKRLATYDLSRKSQKAVLAASSLLTMKFAMSKISNIWGLDGPQTVKYYSNKVWFILKEYMKSSELEEVKTSLRELDIPHFHHEVIYEAIVLAMEQRVSEFEKHAQTIIDLLQFLGKTSIVTDTQLKCGFKRVLDDLDELTVDIPNAVNLFCTFCDMCVSQSFMCMETYELLHPNRGRKRFVSEGDGGKIKATI